MLQQQQESNPKQECLIPLSQSQIKDLIDYCQYTQHIVLPHQVQPIFQTHLYQSLTQSLDSMQMSQINQIQQLDGIKFPKYQQYILQKITDFQTICIELFYLIFSCLRKKLMINFHENLIIYLEQYDKFMVVVKQISEFNNMANKKINEEYKNYYNLYLQIIKEILEVIEKNINKMRSIDIDEIIIKNKIEQAINPNIQKIIKSKLKEEDVERLLARINMLYKDANLIKSSQQIANTDTKCFVELEKCQFIATKSVLYKIRNRSVNIILFRYQNKKENKQKFITAVKNENQLRQKYIQQKILKKYNQEYLADLSKKMDINFQKYVQEGWNENPIYVRVIQQDIRDSGDNKNGNTLDTKIFFKAKLKPIVEQSFIKKEKQKMLQKQGPKSMPGQKPAQKQKQQVMQYSIEYNISKSKMTARLHTTISLDASNSDSILYQWNTLSFQSATITLEIGQKIQMMQKRKKYIIIKSQSNLQPGDPSISRCLYLMDVAMAGYVCIAQETKLNEAEGYSGYKMNEIQEIYKKINHYMNIMRQLNSKLFNSV